MACPFFLPTGRLDEGLPSLKTHAPRLPLGDSYRGICKATPEGFEPPEPVQREVCNCGYARGRCERFPGASGADAVRFSVTGDRDGQIRLVYIFEKNHSPLDYGLLDYSLDETQRLPEVAAELPALLLTLQARAFLQSYLRRRINTPE